MIKRTAEKVMSIIGIIITAIVGLLGAGALFLSGNEDFKNRLAENLNSVQSNTDTSSIVATMGSSGNVLIWSAVITVILAVIALFNLKKNSRASLAGILFILAGIVILISSFFIGLVPAVLFIITGILSLKKKPEQVEASYKETSERYPS